MGVIQTVSASKMFGQEQSMQVHHRETFVANWAPEAIVRGTLTISPDNTRIAYVERIGSKMAVLLDGKRQTVYDEIYVQLQSGPLPSQGAFQAFLIAPKTAEDDFMKFSPDSKRFVYAAWKSDKKDIWMVVDGREEPHYSSVGFPTFSPDSSRFIYTASRSTSKGTRTFLVENGKEHKESYWLIGGSPAFSVDSKRFSYAAADSQDKRYIVVDGVKTERPKGGRSAAVSPDGLKVAVASQNQVFVNGIASKRFDAIGIPMTFSPDSQHLAYVAISVSADKANSPVHEKLGLPARAVVDGVEHDLHDSVEEFLFSPNSERLAYKAMDDGSFLVVCDGVRGERYEELGELVFSRDSRRLAYSARRGNTWLVVVDGTESRPYDSVHTLTFRPDSKTLAFVASLMGREFVVSEFVEGQRYDEVARGALIFNHDGSVAYSARQGGRSFPVLNGRPGDAFDLFAIGGRFTADSNGKLRAFAVREHKLYLVELEP
jgi:hypothetical protein